MLRRLPLRAALAALAVPVVVPALLSGPADARAADPGSPPVSGPAADPAARQAEARTASARPRLVTRRAKRQAVAQATAKAVDQPLSVTIDQLTPSTIQESGRIRVSGHITNDDDETWRMINVYAFISEEPMTSSAQLAAAAHTPADEVVGPRITEGEHKDEIEELAPGQTAEYDLSIPRRLLQADTPGVYWFGVHALGENADGRDTEADGKARTFLPLVPQAREGRLSTAVVIPLRRQLVYADDGSVDDLAGWTTALSDGGRLRSLVDLGASAGDREVTWLVDPALIDAVRRLADGNPGRSLAPNLEAGEADGEDTPTEGTDGADGTDGAGDPTTTATPTPEPSPTPSATDDEGGESPLDLDALDPVVQAAADAAQDWLTRLDGAVRPEDQVLTLPYGDVDVAGAAAHDPQLLRRAVARSGNALPGLDLTTTPAYASPGGYLTAQGIAAAEPGTTILLTDAMFPGPAPGVAVVDGHRALVASSGAAAGGPGPDTRTGPTAMRQRLLAEAAVRFLRGGDEPLTMVVPHDWNPTDASSYFSGLDVPWLDLTRVDQISATHAAQTVDSSTLRYPGWQQEAELDQPGFDAADALIRSGSMLQNLLTLNNVVAGTVADEALGTVSYSARTSPIVNRASADGSRRWIEERLGRVRVSAPPRGHALQRQRPVLRHRRQRPRPARHRRAGRRLRRPAEHPRAAGRRRRRRQAGLGAAHRAHRRERRARRLDHGHRQARQPARRPDRPEDPLGAGEQRDLAVHRHRRRAAVRRDRRAALPPHPRRPARPAQHEHPGRHRGRARP
ncbi:hypothetical protein G5V58_22800 [Nocardioides anomalus]|uniref:Uncharacterized protein n=1 Tax=Nocardioides anomalus TaxID=2712223 RepID=A0A6G6WJ36_9ACTN|nr:hypothetical protein [Nocardioides anomalus]QIG45216.1 hypothetical protein G5V58_22800 [Nocardioides anomalus]